jgi:hypothetical protein
VDIDTGRGRLNATKRRDGRDSAHAREGERLGESEDQFRN